MAYKDLDKKRTFERRYREENRERINLIRHRSRMKKTYGLSLEEIEALRESQDNKCPICSRDFSEAAERSDFAVDRCHETGQVRGLLCNMCNRGLGHFNDDPELLEKAIDYLGVRV